MDYFNQMIKSSIQMFLQEFQLLLQRCLLKQPVTDISNIQVERQTIFTISNNARLYFLNLIEQFRQIRSQQLTALKIKFMNDINKILQLKSPNIFPKIQLSLTLPWNRIHYILTTAQIEVNLWTSRAMASLPDLTKLARERVRSISDQIEPLYPDDISVGIGYKMVSGSCANLIEGIQHANQLIINKRRAYQLMFVTIKQKEKQSGKLKKRGKFRPKTGLFDGKKSFINHSKKIYDRTIESRMSRNRIQAAQAKLYFSTILWSSKQIKPHQPKSQSVGRLKSKKLISINNYTVFLPPSMIF